MTQTSKTINVKTIPWRAAWVARFSFQAELEVVCVRVKPHGRHLRLQGVTGDRIVSNRGVFTTREEALDELHARCSEQVGKAEEAVIEARRRLRAVVDLMQSGYPR